MPSLHTDLHVAMLKKFLDQGQPARDGLYGLQWGDPDHYPPLVPIRDHWVLPHVCPDKTALEIGPAGGRWTRYLLPFRRLYVVDYHAELLAELRKNFAHPNIIEILNNGTDFPGVPPRSVDFVFSFGCFVHLDAHIIRAYLVNLHAVIHPATQLVIHYSDKDKPVAREWPDFSDNDPRRMRAMVERAGYRIEEEDTTTLDSASLMRFVPVRRSFVPPLLRSWARFWPHSGH
jgi:SAM-dependent methyltransferase